MTVARLILGYYHPWPNDAGFYAARAHGHTEAAGIDLRIGVVDPGRGDTLAHLARGEGDLGVVPTNRLLAARARGQQVVAVATINQTGLESIHSLGSLGITRPRDLAGRRIALNPTPRGLAMVRHLVAADGGDPDAIIVVDSGSRELQSQDLLDGFADAYFGAYWAWDELFDSYAGTDRLSWPVKDHGAPAFPSYVLVAREEWAEANGDALRGLLRAAEAGFRHAATDPDAPAEFDLVAPYFSREAIRRSFELISPTWFADDRWGVIPEEVIASYGRWLADTGAIPDLSGLPGATTTAYLSAAAEPAGVGGAGR